MHSPPLPETIADVTPSWLTTVLSNDPAWRGRRIVCLDVEPLGEADALASSTFIAHVGIGCTDGSTKTGELFLKLHTADPAQRDDAGYAAEAFFYRELAARMTIPVPLTWLASFEKRTGRFIIIQEFLRDGWIGSSQSSLSVADLKRVLHALATLHASRWCSPEIAGMSGVRPFHPVIKRAIANLKSGALDVRYFLDGFGALVDPKLNDAYATMPCWMEQVANRFSPAVTLVHLDCSAKNIFLPHDPARLPVLFDWALFRSGNPGLDLATLLCYSMDPDEHDHLPDLVRHYHQMLIDLGIDGYEYDTLWDDVRCGCLWRMAAPVFNASLGTASRDNHARTIIPGIDSCVLCSGAFDLLRSSQ